MMEGSRMKTTKRALLALLLALAPVRALSASILWVSVDPDAKVYREGADESDVLVRTFGVNAAKVSIADASGAVNAQYLLFAYDEPDAGGMVTDDPSSNTMELSFSGSSGGEGGGSGGEGSGVGGQSGGGWIPVCLADLSQIVDVDLKTIALELGYVDWNAYENNYDPDDPATWEVSFSRMAVATASLRDLIDAPHICEQSDLSEPEATPWSPDRFTAVPEPSVCLTALLGALLLAKRRRGGARGQSPAGS